MDGRKRRLSTLPCFHSNTTHSLPPLYPLLAKPTPSQKQKTQQQRNHGRHVHLPSWFGLQRRPPHLHHPQARLPSPRQVRLPARLHGLPHAHYACSRCYRRWLRQMSRVGTKGVLDKAAAPSGTPILISLTYHQPTYPPGREILTSFPRLRRLFQG
ncbi:hypothetical protein LX32DRAFT_130083 [Colletotrichum zoysiae]|uniref:Uncharacterized protein n=1 Tax=Colletotrichum zoysiae TaxID=1216348 RepID=A0AAD9M625_9PEZI|nr:hypothetical protein LX32DRAFT_130083 [Colletotrichum zoysiae]